MCELGIDPNRHDTFNGSTRTDLRIEISDYLIARIGEPWLHDSWRRENSTVVVTAVAGKDAPVIPSSTQSFLKSRASVSMILRRNAQGVGRPHKAYCVRVALCEWFSGIRYAIDWKQLIAENRSRGVKLLARFPRSVLRLKAQQLLQERGAFWNEETTDKFPNMRPKIDAELAAVADEFASGRLTWCERDVQRLITPYPPRHKVDRVLENLGEDFYHDEVHCITDGHDDTAVAEDDTAVAESDQEAAEPSSDEDDGDEEPSEHVLAAGTGEGVEGAEIVDFEGSRMEVAPLSADEADALHIARATMAALEASIDTLRSIGAVRGVQCIELELNTEKRKQECLSTKIPQSRTLSCGYAGLRTRTDS